MGYLLFYNPDSANIVVRMALEELGLDYRDEQIHRRRTGRSEEFMRLNPRGLLPLLVDEDAGLSISETGAILLYLADHHGRLAPPADAGQPRAELLKWLFFISNTLHADLRIQFYTDRYVGDPSHMDAQRARMRERLEGHLGLVEQALGQHDGRYFLGDELTVTDFYLGCCVRWAQLYPSGDRVNAAALSAFPSLIGYLKRLEQVPSIARACEREGIPQPFFVDPVEVLPPVT